MTGIMMPRPNARQDLFFRAKQKYVIIGGARGGGKSWAVRWKALLLCFRYPGIRVLIMRRSFPELLANHINPLKDILHGVAKYNGTEHEFRCFATTSTRSRTWTRKWRTTWRMNGGISA